MMGYRNQILRAAAGFGMKWWWLLHGFGTLYIVKRNDVSVSYDYTLINLFISRYQGYIYLTNFYLLIYEQATVSRFGQ